MSLPIICAMAGRPVEFFLIESRMRFSGVDVEWTRKYSVQ